MHRAPADSPRGRSSEEEGTKEGGDAVKVIIAGGRDVTDYSAVVSAVKESGFEITEVVSGAARGVDRLGELFAEANNIPVKRFPAAWDKYGRGAGHIRNGEMANYAGGLIAVWDGESRGTRNMIDQARSKGLQVFVYRLK